MARKIFIPPFDEEASLLRQKAKEEKQQERLERDALREDIVKYLDPYGLEIDDFAAQIREFFNDSTEHFDRIAYRDGIAKHLGLDMARDEDRDTLFAIIGKTGGNGGISWKVIDQWKSGELDVPLEVFRVYTRKYPFNNMRTEINLFEDTDPWKPLRICIARTLSYIMVFPPIDVNIPDMSWYESPKELADCWKFLKSHPHYRLPADKSKPPPDHPPRPPRQKLNQNALDLAQEKHARCLFMDEGELGKWKHEIESGRDTEYARLRQYALFKYATYHELKGTHRPTANPDRIIWDRQKLNYTGVWGLNNG